MHLNDSSVACNLILQLGLLRLPAWPSRGRLRGKRHCIGLNLAILGNGGEWGRRGGWVSVRTLILSTKTQKSLLCREREKLHDRAGFLLGFFFFFFGSVYWFSYKPYIRLSLGMQQTPIPLEVSSQPALWALSLFPAFSLSRGRAYL